MKKLLPFLLSIAVIACSSDKSEPSIYGNWITDLSPGSGVGLTLQEDGTYIEIELVLTSDTTANAQIATGTFSVSGQSFTSETKQSSCPDAKADPETVSFKLTDSALALVFPQGIISLEHNDASPATEFIIRYGCFKGGQFTPSNLAAVSQ